MPAPRPVLRLQSALLAAALGGCLNPQPSPPDDAPVTIAAIERDDEGRPVLRILEGAMPDLEGRTVGLPPGPTTFLIRHEGRGEEWGEEAPTAALWLRGAGTARHILPSLGSPPLRIDTMEDWEVSLPAGLYELSVTLGSGGPGPSARLLVR